MPSPGSGCSESSTCSASGSPSPTSAAARSSTPARRHGPAASSSRSPTCPGPGWSTCSPTWAGRPAWPSPIRWPGSSRCSITAPRSPPGWTATSRPPPPPARPPSRSSTPPPGSAVGPGAKQQRPAKFAASGRPLAGVLYRDAMTVLSYERCCAEIVAQTDLLRSCIEGADLTVPVPSCPGWNAGQLLRHLGGARRWAGGVVASRADGPVPEPEDVRDLSAYAREDPAVVGPWLAEGAAALARALRAAGPDAPLWTPVPGGNASFYARRFTHETAIHRADSTLALGQPYRLDQDVALYAVDEWMQLGSLPMQFEIHPPMRALLRPRPTPPL